MLVLEFSKQSVNFTPRTFILIATRFIADLSGWKTDGNAGGWRIHLCGCLPSLPIGINPHQGLDIQSGMRCEHGTDTNRKNPE